MNVKLLGDMTSLTTRMAWGVPVRPDLLGQHLEAYLSFLPTLTALRLCHRYGTGGEAHITKLPVEILSAIEELVFEALLTKYNDWADRFCHFESRCAPSHHFDGDHFESFSAHFLELISDKNCEECRSGEARDECEECEKLTNDAVEDALAERYPDYRFEECADERTKWEEMIDQRPKGNFRKFDELLRKHFGVEAYFAPTRATEEHPKAWPSHPNHHWEFLDVLETTICYIVVPGKPSHEASYPLSECEAGGGGASIRAAQSSLVQIPSLATTAKRAKQFRHMLRSLRLKPYIHESQLVDRLAASLDEEDSASKPKQETNSVASETDSTEANDFENTEWPQLVMLVKSQFNWPWP